MEANRECTIGTKCAIFLCTVSTSVESCETSFTRRASKLRSNVNYHEAFVVSLITRSTRGTKEMDFRVILFLQLKLCFHANLCGL